MLKRRCYRLLTERLAEYPAVVLIGPRQCGKTTLARSLEGRYYDLEQEPERLRLDLEWPRVTAGGELIVLDEAQAWPEVFNRLRGAIDADRGRPGRFLLLGSVAPSLMARVSESLAGRLSVVQLTPFLLDELPTEAAKARRWLCGGFPDGGVLRPRRFPQWQDDYLTLLTERDLPAWGLAARPRVSQRLARMIAAVHGQQWNASQIAASLGLNYQTINSYLDYFEGAFLVRRLAPLHANIRKRLVKSPKVYFRDSGLLHAVLKVETHEQLLGQPWVGASWEGHVIEQVLGTLSATGARFDAHYLRTSDGFEIDLVVDRAGTRWAIEAKLTTSPSPADLARLTKTAALIDAAGSFLVTQSPQIVEGNNAVVCNLPWFLERLTRADGNQ